MKITNAHLICFNSCLQGRDFLNKGRQLVQAGNLHAKTGNPFITIESKRKALGLTSFEAEHIMWMHELYRLGRLHEEQRN